MIEVALLLLWWAAAPPEVDPTTGARARGELSRERRAILQPPRPSTTQISELGQLGLRAQEDGSLHYADPAGEFKAAIRADGKVLFSDRFRKISDFDPDNGRCCVAAEVAAAIALLGLGMPMSGPSEWILKANDHDVLHNRKAALLASTREIRTQLAITWTQDRIREQLASLEPELLDVWTATIKLPDPAKRRAVLFQLWDECDELFSIAPDEMTEEAASQIDRYRIEAASTARRKIEAFVRRHLPKTSPNAYRQNEIRSFNLRRVSREPFDPYSSGPRGH